MSLDQQLQHRVQPEESTVMKAAEGLSPEQRILARIIELEAIKDNADSELKDLKDTLKSWYKENAIDKEGNKLPDAPVLQVGRTIYSPTVSQTWEYDTPAFISRFGKQAVDYVKVEPGKVTKALEIGIIKPADLEGIRTAKEPVITHRVSQEK